MARVRQARPCSARRTNGQECRNYAINGGWVCAAHGGRSPQVKRAARERVVRHQLRRAFDVAYAKHQAELAEWQATRIVITAHLLDIPVDEVTPALIGLCSAMHGAPEPLEAAPTLRMDRRFGPRAR